MLGRPANKNLTILARHGAPVLLSCMRGPRCNDDLRRLDGLRKDRSTGAHDKAIAQDISRGVGKLAEVALFYDDVYLKHDTGSHPENGDRVRYCRDYLNSSSLFDKLTTPRPRPATEEEILLVHSKKYYDYLHSLSGNRILALDADTLFSPGSLEAAIFAAGAVTMAVESISTGSCDRAFCLIRPPGHHAMSNRAMGFCIFNNIAIGAALAAGKCGLERPAIIDFDVHHGNGTQEIFYTNQDVLYCSTHQWPFYPGTGAPEEDGQGPGKGKTVNVSLRAGSGDSEYVEALSSVILPAIRKHRPSILLISAGFDAHRGDPIGGMNVTTDGFREITRVIVRTADEVCGGRLVSALEGGYNIEALAASVHAHVEALLD